MQDLRVRGIVIGVLAASVTWIVSSTDAGVVSLFPDLLSFALLAVLIALSLRGRLGPAVTANDVLRMAATLGVSAGLVIGLSTGARAIVRWSGPDPTMVAITVIVSIVIVLLVSLAVALLAYASSRRSEHAGA